MDVPTLHVPAATTVPTAPSPLDPIFDAFEAGHHAQLLTGRGLLDLVVARDEKLRPFEEALRREARRRFGMTTLAYSRSGGLDWEEGRFEDAADRTSVLGLLQAHGLFDLTPESGPGPNTEVVRALRGLAAAACAPADGLRWADGRPMKLLVLLPFAEHLAPQSVHGRTDEEIAAVEVAYALAQRLSLRKAGHLVLFHGRADRVDELVAGVLHRTHVPMPGEAEKRAFLAITLRDYYPDARFADGFDAEAVARLTSNTPNAGLEVRLRDSHRRRRPVSADALVAQKTADTLALSEGTLAVLDVRRVDGVRLVGRTVAAMLRVMERLGEGLLRGDRRMPGAVILVGPPGGGKTDGALLAARAALASAYALLSPKDGLVGGTERKARLQMDLLGTLTPCIGFVDEITEAFNLERGGVDLDAGASRAVLAAFLTALSDESRRGRSLVVGTTNCPWRMGEAMRSRFTFVPVLGPLVEDYPAIVTGLAVRLDPALAPLETEFSAEPEVAEAARLFHAKGASPREVQGAIAEALLYDGALTPATVLGAARSVCPRADRLSSVFADLWAVKACSSRRFFPWADDPAAFPFPEHLAGLVDRKTGEVDYAALDQAIRTLEPRCNV